MARGRKIDSTEDTAAGTPLNTFIEAQETPSADQCTVSSESDPVERVTEADEVENEVLRMTESDKPSAATSSLRDMTMLSPEQRRGLLIDGMSAILRAPKVKGDPPTLVRFHEKDSIGLRAVLIDVGAPVLCDAWNYYRENADSPSSSEFLQHVYDITKMRIPRMYRIVAELRLD